MIRSTEGSRSEGVEWNIVDIAVGLAVARLAETAWATYNLLQPLPPLDKDRCVDRIMDAIPDAYGGVYESSMAQACASTNLLQLEKATRIAILDEAGKNLCFDRPAIEAGHYARLHSIRAAAEFLSDIRKGQILLTERT